MTKLLGATIERLSEGMVPEDLVRIESVSKRSRSNFDLEKYSSTSFAHGEQSSARETVETRCHTDISGLDFFKTSPMYKKSLP